MKVPRPASEPLPRGIYDCDGAHRSPTRADYERLFQTGVVALDTNVLLNLYRSNERTRTDTLAVLSKLRERLWVPHQVLTEFWRNREKSSIRHHHSSKAKEAHAALEKVTRSAEDALDRWVTSVHLKNDTGVKDQIEGNLERIAQAMSDLRALIEAQASKDALTGTSRTETDPVLAALEPILRGRVGNPLTPDEYAKAIQEAQVRAEEEIPPGYEDFRTKSPEQAAGDYILWLQLLKEAETQTSDVLLVTGDVKKDWWVPREGDIPARPHTELVAEMRNRTGATLFMLSPGELLTWADELLGLQVDEGSVNDLDQLRETEPIIDLTDNSWTVDSLQSFMLQLMGRYQAQSKVLIAAGAMGGFVDRARVYELAGYSPERQLKGFTRPIGTVTRELVETGDLTGNEPFLLHAVYDSDAELGWATGFRIPEEVIPLMQELFGQTTIWRAAQQQDASPPA